MRILPAIAVLLLVSQSATLAEDVSFSRQLAPILARRCLGCHNNRKNEGRYALHTFEMFMKAGDSEDSPIVAGRADESYLFEKLIEPDDDLRMPQEDTALTPKDIELFRQWIDQGAKFDGPDASNDLTSLLPTREHPVPPASYRTPVPVFAVKFSRDGKYLFTGGWNELLVWDVESGTLKNRIAGLPQRIHSIEYSPNRKRLAVGGGAPGEYGEIRLVDVESIVTTKSGGKHALLASLGDVVIDLCFTSTSLIAGGADNSVRCYDVETRQQQWSNTQHVDWVTSVDVTAYRFAEQQATNEDLPDFFTLNDQEQQGKSHVEQLWRFDSGNFIVRKANWELNVSDGKTRMLTQITTSGVGKNYKVKRESYSGDELSKHAKTVEYLRRVQSQWPVENAGSEFVVSSSKDRTAKVFLQSNGKLFTTYKGHRREYGPLKGLHRVFGVQAEANSRRLWSVGEGKHLHGWNPVTVRDEDGTAADMEKRFAKEYSIDLLRHDFPEPVFALLRRDSQLIAASASGEVKEFAIGAKATFDVDKLATKQTYQGHTDQLYTLDASSTGLIAAAGFTGEVTIWDASTGEIKHRFVAAP